MTCFPATIVEMAIVHCYSTVAIKHGGKMLCSMYEVHAACNNKSAVFLKEHGHSPAVVSDTAPMLRHHAPSNGKMSIYPTQTDVKTIIVLLPHQSLVDVRFCVHGLAKLCSVMLHQGPVACVNI